MPQFSFETKANKRVKEIIADKSTNKVENIIATPFTIDPEYVDKHITIKFESNTKEKEFISTAKQVKLGNYCICMQSIGDMFPYWQNKSIYANLIIAYILKNIQLYGNYVEIPENFVLLYLILVQVIILLFLLLQLKSLYMLSIITLSLEEIMMNL